MHLLFRFNLWKPCFGVFWYLKPSRIKLYLDMASVAMNWLNEEMVTYCTSSLAGCFGFGYWWPKFLHKYVDMTKTKKPVVVHQSRVFFSRWQIDQMGKTLMDLNLHIQLIYVTCRKLLKRRWKSMFWKAAICVVLVWGAISNWQQRCSEDDVMAFVVFLIFESKDRHVS
jgi:hypothetical protein